MPSRVSWTSSTTRTARLVSASLFINAFLFVSLCAAGSVSGRHDFPALSVSTLSHVDHFDRFRQPQKLHDANAPPVDVDLVPGQSMAGRGWVRMMIIVPAFTKGQQRHPPVVS